jgi:hypothetical protein
VRAYAVVRRKQRQPIAARLAARNLTFEHFVESQRLAINRCPTTSKTNGRATMKISALLLASGVLVSPGLGVALAGPCSDQIAELSRLTSGGASPTTTGAVTSPGPAAASTGGAAGTTPGDAATPGTGRQTADQRSGTREMSSVAGQIATSPEDVRRQQEVRPTTAQAADRASERLPMARAKLEEARLLDQQGKAECMALVTEVRAALEAK